MDFVGTTSGTKGRGASKAPQRRRKKTKDAKSEGMSKSHRACALAAATFNTHQENAPNPSAAVRVSDDAVDGGVAFAANYGAANALVVAESTGKADLTQLPFLKNWRMKLRKI